MKSAEASYEFGTLMGFRLLFLLFEICFAVGSFSVCEAAGNGFGLVWFGSVISECCDHIVFMNIDSGVELGCGFDLKRDGILLIDQFSGKNNMIIFMHRVFVCLFVSFCIHQLDGS